MKWYKNPYNWFLLFLVVLNVLPFLAPIFLELAKTIPFFEYPAKAIYFVYSFTCHQLHHRSLHIYDHQCAWCARDVGIWGAMLLVAVLTKRYNLKGIRWYWVLPFVIPMALDGGIQTIATILQVSPGGPTGEPLYISSNFSRFVTGSIFGMGISLWMSPLFLRTMAFDLWGKLPEQMSGASDVFAGFLDKSWKVVVFALGVMLILYIVFIQLWRVTSPNYPPTDFLDSTVRTPAEDFYVRRQNGSCPGGIEDLLQWGCFVRR